MQLFNLVLTSETLRYLYEEVLIPDETDAYILIKLLNHLYCPIILEHITDMEQILSKPIDRKGKIYNLRHGILHHCISAETKLPGWIIEKVVLGR